MNERGPVGGAGELTTAELKLILERLRYSSPLANGFEQLCAALAAKAPQGVPANDSRSQQKRGAAMKGEPMPTFDHEHREEKPCKICAGRATPAPGAERLREPSDEECRKVINSIAGEWHNNLTNVEVYGLAAKYLRPFLGSLREALASAPPAPTKLQQQSIDAQRTGIAPECFSGGKEQIAKSTARNHELEGPALWHEAERIDAITPRYERMEAIATLVKHSRDRHASAERVRPLRDGLERLTKATANFTGSQRSKERVKEALRVAMEILTDDDKKLAGALPPSTGEKS